MLDPRKPLKFKVVEHGTPQVLEVTKGSKKFQLRIAIAVTEILDTGGENPFTREPIFQVNMNAAMEVKPAAGAKKKGKKK